MYKSINLDELKKTLKIIRIAPDISYLTDNQKKVIRYLIKVAEITKELFIFQRAPENKELLAKLKAEGNSTLTELFYIMNGPYNELDDTFFIEGSSKNEKASFYPQDLTRDEWNTLLDQATPEEKELLISPYTVIIRDKNQKLTPVPYHLFYKEYLKKCSDLLYKAAEFADNFYLKSYLETQANAFITNDYNEAYIRWIQLTDNDIEPLLGPHEFYEDKFLGYKAAFTAFIAVRNKLQFQKLSVLMKMSDTLQSILPVPVNYKRNKVEKMSQIIIVDLLYSAGDGRGPVHTAAFNLPNSQKIRSEFGSKKVFLHNIIQAKFDGIMKPISEALLSESDQDKISFDAYFNHILLHEISHGLGIGLIKDAKGNYYDVSYFLKELYSIIEETKADVMGIFALFYLIKQCILVDSNFVESATTYIISILRGIRFGKDNAHGIASIIQWNFLIKEQSLMVNSATLKISLDFHKIEKSIEKLLTILLTLQGEGDYDKCKTFIAMYAQIDDLLHSILAKAENAPVDILPYYPQAGEKEPLVPAEKI